jgi:diguanylate cyclase (GGDEF)-like protein/PAS domain S-box-containing protein
MTQQSNGPAKTSMTRVQELLERLYWSIGTVIIPAAIVVFSVIAIAIWDDLYSSEPQQQLDIRVVPDAARALSPTEALARLATVEPRQQFETRLVEEPFWFLTEAGSDRQEAAYVEIPSRHLTQLACWNAASGALLGQTGEDGSAGTLQRIKAGHALKLDHASDRVLCRASFQGPAKLTAFLWTPPALEISAQDFHRRSGLLDGGILMLAAFVLVTALINRQSLYVIFAAWLVVTLRISATAGGWDHQWLNHQVPADWLPQARSFTRALWAILTVTLLKALLREDLKKVRSAVLIRVAEWLCMALLVAAFVLERDDFLLAMWVIGTVALLAAMVTLVNVVLRTRSMVAVWYCASLAITLFSGLSEIAAAALGVKQLIMVFNTVNAALVSCLLAALAIAEQMRRDHRERLLAKARLQQTYDTIPIGMFTLDMQGRFTSINPALRRMLGQRAFKTTHNTWPQYFGADIWHQLLDLVQNRQDGEIEFRSQLDVTGVELPRRFLLKAAMSGDTIEGSLQDVTEKSMAAEELNFLADNDALTKVLNRRGVEKAFLEAAAVIDEERPLALAYLDLDRFKLINDLYGHNAGDEVLRQVCHRIQRLLAAHMMLGRVGGDEFVILLPDTRMPLATVIARGIIESIDDHPFRVGEKAFYVRGSIGLIEVSPGAQFKEVLTTSDRACREAKTGQHRGLVVYENGSPAFKEHQAELRLIGELSASDTIAGLYLEMQPIMSLTRPSDALNFEVLLRMKDADGDLVPVSRILAAAEDSGRMSRIDHWVLSTTLAWLDQHREQLKRTQFVCINLSGASLNDEEFMHEVFGILRRNSQVCSFLTIEITESVALHDLKNTRRFIDKVRGYGARVALDDFGAGYTSFSYLKELPADLLKIDGSFVVNMNEHPANVSIVEAIVNLARNLGMKTIAEWAEDAATVQALAEIGVDYVQGYAVARPMAPEKLLEVPSAAGFIQDAALKQFVQNQDRQNNPLAQLDLLMDSDKPSPPKIH